MSSSINYSTQAHNILHYFYHSRYLVYVEGQDDLIFWNNVFKIAGINNVHFEEVGSCTALDKKATLITQENAQIVIARDRDHFFFSQKAISHVRIIHTFGYSIENTLYCKNNLNRFTQNAYRTLQDLTDNFMGYITQIENDTYQLLVYDICNHKFEKAISVFGDSCFRFIASDKDCFLSQEKIAEFINGIQHNFSEEEIAHVELLIKQEDKPIKYFIKGHFLTLLIMNYIKVSVSKLIDKPPILISNNLFYTSLIDGCLSCGNNKASCKDIQHLIRCSRNAIDSIV